MKITTLTYQQTFPTGQYMNVKLGMEVTIDDADEDPVEHIYKKMKELTEKTFNEMYPAGIHDYYSGEPATYGQIAQLDVLPPTSIETEIQSCKSIKVLDSYKFIVKGKPELQKIYDEKYLELSK